MAATRADGAAQPGAPASGPVIALIAGELSGDLLGGGLIEALAPQLPGARFVGIGGERMQAAGLTSLFPLDALSVMGVVDVLKALPRLLRLRRDLIAQLKALQPAVVIGIDAPDFNIGVELRLRRAGIPTIHYVSPSVWAWRPKRVFKIAKAVDRVLCLLPFEKAFYDRHQVAADFVGHPMADEIALQPDVAAARGALGLNPPGKLVALLPGSRKSEVGLLAPLFAAVAARLHAADPSLSFVIPLAHAGLEPLVKAALAPHPQLPVILTLRQSRATITSADVVLLASGTATLETMLLKKPMVVAYRFHPFNYWLARKLVKLSHFSLPNLLAGETLVPEYLQDDASELNLCSALSERLYGDNSVLLGRFSELHLQLKRDASARSAAAVLELLKGRVG